MVTIEEGVLTCLFLLLLIFQAFLFDKYSLADCFGPLFPSAATSVSDAPQRINGGALQKLRSSANLLDNYAKDKVSIADSSRVVNDLLTGEQRKNLTPEEVSSLSFNLAGLPPALHFSARQHLALTRARIPVNAAVGSDS